VRRRGKCGERGKERGVTCTSCFWILSTSRKGPLDTGPTSNRRAIRTARPSISMSTRVSARPINPNIHIHIHIHVHIHIHLGKIRFVQRTSAPGQNLNLVWAGRGSIIQRSEAYYGTFPAESINIQRNAYNSKTRMYIYIVY